MAESIEDKLLKIPVVGSLVRFGKKIILPGLEGLSLYDLMENYIVGIGKGTFSSRASSIAFSFFIALFPFILFVLNLMPYVRIKNFQVEFLRLMEELLPAQTSEFFYPIMVDILANPRGSLLSFSLILSIFLMTNGVNAIFTSFEYSFHTQRNRTIVGQYIIALGVSIFLAFVLFLFVAVLIMAQYVIVKLNQEGMMLDVAIWIGIFRYVLFLILIYIIIATLYYYGTKEGKKSKFFSVGALITTILFMVTTYLFAIYINNFSNYNELYGSLGALLIMMFYIWINSNLLLLGYELNATLYKLKSAFQ